MRIVDSTGLLALLTGYLYCVSTAYTEGYLNALGLDSDLLNRNFHQVIYHGLLESMVSLLWLVLIILILTFTYTSWCSFISFQLKKSFKNGRKLVGLKKQFHLSTKKPSNVEARLSKHIFLSVGAFLAVLAFVVNLGLHEKSGIKIANKVIKNIQENQYTALTTQGFKGELAFLYCGSRNCAGFDLNTNKVIYFAQKQLSVQSNRISVSGK